MKLNSLLKTCLIIALTIVFSLSLKAEDDEINIPTINLQKLNGTWLEMARTPNFLQKRCDYSAMNYQISPLEEILITKICITSTGNVQKRELLASLARDKKHRNIGKQLLFVEYTGVMRFFRAFSRGNLMIFYVNEDYTQLIIGSPDKSSFWLLSRDMLTTEQTQDFLNIAEGLGLKSNRLILNHFDSLSKDKILSLLAKH
ncbi:MAG: lipocalin family protein [Alphaproteobacteria bacterium]|nr:lipocalin family protein [Alphaproteobacteria bacterium]